MPAETVHREFCASYYADYDVPSSTGRGSYLVSIDGTSIPHCTCPAYKYSGEPPNQHCKHTDFVFQHACMWNGQWWNGNEPPHVKPVRYHGPPIPDRECPNCGGPVVSVLISV